MSIKYVAFAVVKRLPVLLKGIVSKIKLIVADNNIIFSKLYVDIV